MTERQVDGLIFIDAGASSEELNNLLRDLTIPLVLVDRLVPGVDVDYVTVTNIKGGLDATNHLLGLGHRRIAFLSGPENLPTSSDRRTGYAQALAGAGIPLDESLIYTGDF